MFRQEYEKEIWKTIVRTKMRPQVCSVSHNPAIIIILYANAEEVCNYSRACFTFLVLPDLRLKCNSARLHRKYRAKPHRQAQSKGLCWLWGQGLGRALQERCRLRKLFEPWAVSFHRGRHTRSCASTVCFQKGRCCSLRETHYVQDLPNCSQRWHPEVSHLGNPLF